MSIALPLRAFAAAGEKALLRTTAQLEQARQNSGEITLPALRRRANELRKTLMEKVDYSLLPEVFALVRLASANLLNMRHYDVQVLAGNYLSRGHLAEVATGEGKTLTATLPLAFYGLSGRGAHLVTANDYLARRDAEWMTPVYESLGMTVGVIEADTSPADRKQAYRCDITYGTAKEFGFDFLRDEIGRRSGQPADSLLQRKPYFVLVDEADSILIDDARTPLLISATNSDEAAQREAAFRWAAEHVREDFHQGQHYTFDHEKRLLELNFTGRQKVRSLPPPAGFDSLSVQEAMDFIERAAMVREQFHRDVQYVVVKDEVVIIDEGTGRPAEGRQWSGGIHQAVEAKECLEKITPEAGHAARITVQDFFMRYPHLGCMTGTAKASAGEFRGVYKLSVVPIPTHRRSQRVMLSTQVFKNREEKFAAICRETKQMHEKGRPVLIGSRTIEQSEALSKVLREAGLAHDVLNAHMLEEEAAIVARAGQSGKITVATNMAGRGTDIKLPSAVMEQGGLHVIGTELHESPRIDRQLIGRCGRQGDPGSFRQYLAWDDDIFRLAYGPCKAAKIAEAGGRANSSATRAFYRAQASLAARHRQQRKVLLHQERQRTKMLRRMSLNPYLDTCDDDG